jgi:hypothetical protein
LTVPGTPEIVLALKQGDRDLVPTLRDLITPDLGPVLDLEMDKMTHERGLGLDLNIVKETSVETVSLADSR